MESNDLFEEGEDFPFVSVSSDDITDDIATQAAKNAFGIKYLFAWQKLVIANILDAAQGEKADDDLYESDEFCRSRQIVLLPTGAGKSLCFLTPALLLDGPTLVLYPLLALMADQQRRMEKGNLKCVVFKGEQTEEEREQNFIDLKNGAKIILANPEVLQNEKLVARLSEYNIKHIAIDEAHCVSEWGDSFRPAYLTLGKIIKDLKCQTITAFTATASPPILNRISEVLFDGQAHIIKSSSDRQNIHYAVEYAYAKQKAAFKLSKQLEKPMIIFCGTRRRTEQMAHLLDEYFQDDVVKFYHAGMTKEEKNKIEKWFFDSQDGILCATCAYGMGVDKANIKTVIHLDAPEHLENFIQEAGRAGRDGSNVKSVLLWNHWDSLRHRQYDENSREKAIGNFALSKTCRREFLLDYLNDETEKNGCSGCDICDAKKNKTTITYEAKDGKKAFDFIKTCRRLYKKDEASALVKEKFNKMDLSEFGINIWEEKDMSEIFSQLISEKKILRLGGLWKNHLDIKLKKPILTSRILKIIPRRHRRYLHRLRKKFRHLQERVQQMMT